MDEISIDGTSAVITGRETELSSIFSYVKIDTICDTEDAEVGENVSLDNISNTRKNKNANEKEDEKPINKKIFPINEEIGNATVKGYTDFEIKMNSKIYIEDTYEYFELSFDYNSDIYVEFSEKAETRLSINGLRFPVLSFIEVKITPSIILSADATITATGSFDGSIGFRYNSAKGIQNISTAPIFKPEITMQGRLYVGLALTPQISLIHSKFYDFKYTVNNDGTCNIIGYVGYDSKLTIPSELTGYRVVSISNNAFYNIPYISEVTVPDSVVDVGNNAFGNCINLEKVTFSDTITKIGDSCFKDCKELKEVILPKNLISIGNSAFYNCSALVYIEIPESVTEIKQSAFGRCKSLKEIIIPSGVTSIEYGIFEECTNLENVVLTDNITYIGYGAFRYCERLEKIYLSENITFIGGYAFNNCKSLKSIILPSGIEALDEGTFAHCTSLTEVELPDNLTVLDVGDFYNCNQLKTIVLPSNLTEIGAQCFSYCKSLEEIRIPDKVDTIGDSAFQYCNGLISVELPEALKTVDEKTFSGCKALINITFPEKIRYIRARAFENCTSLETVDFPDELFYLGEKAFTGCSSLLSIVLPEGLEEISGSTFYECSNLNHVSIPEGVKKIGWGAFYFTNVNHVKLPSTVTHCDDYAFGLNVMIVTLPKGIIRKKYSFVAYSGLGFEGIQYTWIEPAADDNEDDVIIPIENALPESAEEATSVIFENADILSNDDASSITEKIYPREAYFEGLKNYETYNVYVLKSLEAENLLSSDNLLYIGQKNADSYAKLHLSYSATENCENAEVIAVPMLKINISDAEVSIDTINYTSQEQLIDPKVTLNNKLLEEGRDYYLENNFIAEIPGEYIITITGMGFYTGSIDAKYTIYDDNNDIKEIPINDLSSSIQVMISDNIRLINNTEKIVKWESNNHRIATIDEYGTVEINSTGKVIFTALSENNNEYSIELIIVDTNCTIGDVNEDGSVDSSDASLVLAEYAKIQTGGAGEFNDIQKKSADVNNDSVVDSSDASKILAYYAMISTGKEPTWD